MLKVKHKKTEIYLVLSAGDREGDMMIETRRLILREMTDTRTEWRSICMLGKSVKVTVDRPLGSYHPEHKDLNYPINYGFVEGIPAPDGEEQDAYVLGVQEAVSEFTGRVIAIIHRKDDVEEKWVIAPEGMSFSEQEIMEQVHFQEQYFQSEVRMWKGMDSV